jgi:hypothetical protein
MAGGGKETKLSKEEKLELAKQQRDIEKNVFRTDYFLYKNAQKPQQMNEQMFVPLMYYQTNPPPTNKDS